MNKNQTILEKQIAPLLRGRSVNKWIESIVLDLLSISEQTSPPIIINTKLLNDRRIKTIHYSESLPFSGHLIINPDNFIIELANSISGWYERFVIAHELGHTYFFDVTNIPIKPKLYSMPNHQELEWFCDLFARNLLIPKMMLLDEREVVTSKSQLTAGSLTFLAQKFNVPEFVMAERVVTDLLINQNLILSFERKGGNEDGVWRLNWHVIGERYKKVIFIPIGHFEHGKKLITPKVKSNLLHTIAEIYPQLQNQKSASITLNPVDFQGSTLGNLYKYLAYKEKVNTSWVYSFYQNQDLEEISEYLLCSISLDG